MQTSEPQKPLHAQELEADLLVLVDDLSGIAIAREAASRGLRVIACLEKDINANNPPFINGACHLRKLEQLHFELVLSYLDSLRAITKTFPHLAESQRCGVLTAKTETVRNPYKIKLGLRIYRRLLKHYNLIAPAAGNSAPLEYNDIQLDIHRLAIHEWLNARDAGVEFLQGHSVERALREQKQWKVELVPNTFSPENTARKIICAPVMVSSCSNTSAKMTKWTAGTTQNHEMPLTKRSPNAKGASTGTREESVQSRCRSDYLEAAYLFVELDNNLSTRQVLQAPNGALITAAPLTENIACIYPVINFGVNKNLAEREKAISTVLNQLRIDAEVNPLQIIRCDWYTLPTLNLSRTKHSGKDNDVGFSALDLNNPGKLAPLLTIFGQSFGQSRKLAHDALEILAPFFRYTTNQGEPKQSEPLSQLRKRFNWLEISLWRRLESTYGERLNSLLENVNTRDDLGEHFGCGLYQKEVEYLYYEERARDVQTLLWQRTHLGLRFETPEAIRKLSSFLEKLSTTQNTDQLFLSSGS